MMSVGPKLASLVHKFGTLTAFSFVTVFIALKDHSV